MSAADPVEQIVNAVLYEGYILYPYRPSAVKNQVRWTFGGIHPRGYSEEHGFAEAWQMCTQCLLVPEPGCSLDIEVRFLQLLERREAGRLPWQEATERRFGRQGVDLTALQAGTLEVPVALSAGLEESHGISREWVAIEAMIAISAEPVAQGAVRLTVEISNRTPVQPGLGREQAMLHSLVSAHTVLRISGGAFVSMTDPPPNLTEAAAGSRNVGTWPVMVGEEGETSTILSSPIILADYPRVADESPGELFDSTEIDEILTLRILSLTEAEKAEVREGDEHARRLLERTEALTSEDMMRMHGTIRGLSRGSGSDE